MSPRAGHMENFRTLERQYSFSTQRHCPPRTTDYNVLQKLCYCLLPKYTFLWTDSMVPKVIADFWYSRSYENITFSNNISLVLTNTFHPPSILILYIWRLIPRCRTVDEENSMVRRITTSVILEQTGNMELRFRASSEMGKKLLLTAN